MKALPGAVTSRPICARSPGRSGFECSPLRIPAWLGASCRKGTPSVSSRRASVRSFSAEWVGQCAPHGVGHQRRNRAVLQLGASKSGLRFEQQRGMGGETADSVAGTLRGVSLGHLYRIGTSEVVALYPSEHARRMTGFFFRSLSSAAAGSVMISGGCELSMCTSGRITSNSVSKWTACQRRCASASP